MFTNELLTEIAEAHQKYVAQIVLRWLVQRDVVVIPKTVYKERMVENRGVFDFELSGKQMEKIATLDTKESLFFSHRDPKMVSG